MNKEQIIDSIKYQLTRLRGEASNVGDSADLVYIGEDIGKLICALNILKDYNIPWKERSTED